MQMSNIHRRHPLWYMKGNHCRIGILAGIFYGDIGNTYITPTFYVEALNNISFFKVDCTEASYNWPLLFLGGLI